MLKAVVFDLDGTLVDTMGFFADVAADVIAQRHGWTLEAGRRAYFETSGIPFCQQLEVLFPGHPDNPELERDFETRKMAAYDGLGLLDDVPPALAGLAERGVSVAVSSNNREDVVRDYLAGQGAHFDVVLGYREGFAKGEAHFSHVEHSLGVDRTHMLFVGDSVHDAELARQAGVRFAARLGTVPRTSFEASPDDVLFIEPGHLSELLRLVE